MIGLYILPMTLLGSFGSLALKKASSSSSFLHLITCKYLYLGAFLYGLASVIHVLSLKHYDMSLIAPLTALTYVWTLFVSAHFLREAVTIGKIIGIAFIHSVGSVFYLLIC